MPINDHWTIELDDLGMQGTGDALAKQILACRPPYAICVQGKWGSGKTSLMRYAMARLGGQPLSTVLETSNKQTSELPSDLEEQWKERSEEAQSWIEAELRKQFLTPPSRFSNKIQIVPIWFNPWQHQDAPIPVVALLQELRRQFSLLLKFGNKASKLSAVAVEAGLSMVGDLIDTFSVLQGGPRTGALRGTAAQIRQVGEAYEQRNFETVHDAQRINLLFREAVGRLLRRSTKEDKIPNGRHGTPVPLRRLVIFVDDLDRCAEHQTVRLLEAIKLYLQNPHCVFVFGMDSTAARRAVRAVLCQGGDEIAREYLEKLFQHTVHVPIPRNCGSFVASLLEQHGLVEDKESDEAPSMGQAVADLVEPNPRKIKNFVNGLAAGWDEARKAIGDGFRFDFYLIVSYLRSYHPDVFRLISYDPSQVDSLHYVLASQEPKIDPPPTQYFFDKAFRHAFSTVPRLREDALPLRGDSDAVVDELTERLDRHRSDSAFRNLWLATFGEDAKNTPAQKLRPYLRSEAAFA